MMHLFWKATTESSLLRFGFLLCVVMVNCFITSVIIKPFGQGYRDQNLTDSIKMSVVQAVNCVLFCEFLNHCYISSIYHMSSGGPQTGDCRRGAGTYRGKGGAG